MIRSINHVTVVGAGLMGSGIAQVAAQSGFNVTLVDLDASLIQKSQKNIMRNLERVAKRQFSSNDKLRMKTFVEESFARIRSSTNVEESVRTTDIVIEAIIENLEAKQKLFALIDTIAPPSTIFASNTSALSIADISKLTKRLDRFCGLHFFNPVPVMELLEVIRIPETSQATYETVMAFGQKLGKTCVTCKDTPGFIVNRLLLPYMAEAYRMLDRGDATVEDIDTAMKLGLRYPMGPFELSDYVGLDTQKNILDNYASLDPDNPLYQKRSKLDELVAAGKFGVKSGEGFYKYKL